MNRKQRRAAKKGAADTAPPGADVRPMLETAIQHHQAGRLAQAESIYRTILSSHPGEPDTLNLLGVLRHQFGDHVQAIDLIGRALRAAPGIALYHNNLGAALRADGNNEEAAKHYRQAISLNPSYPDAYNNLGNALMDMDRPEEAIESYRRVLEISPDFADAHTGAGSALMALNRVEEAGPHFRQAVALDPHSSLAHKNLANLAEREGDRDQAVAHLRMACSLAPNDVELLCDLGAALRECYLLDEAVTCLEKAVAIDPNHVGASYTLGLVLKELDRLDEAIVRMRATVELAPDDVDVLNGLGNMLKEQGRPDEAIAAYEAALAVAPDHEIVRTNRALLRLSRGEFSEGWKDYLFRGSVSEKRDRLSRDAIGADLSGRRLFLLRDQGLGDEIFFLRFVQILKSRGAWIGYRADSKIAGMVARLPFIDEVFVGDNEPASYDTLLSPGDLPWLLDMDSAADIPPSIELATLPDRLVSIRGRLIDFGPPPYIGVTWRAGIQLRNKLSKISPEGAIAKALRSVTGTVVALQRGPLEGELDTFGEVLDRPILDMTTLNDDLEGMLAVLEYLDDYVCVSNTNTHLRAALGKTSRVLVPYPADYRWMMTGDESPWFPGSGIYRQRPDGWWDDAFRRLEGDIVISLGSD